MMIKIYFQNDGGVVEDGDGIVSFPLSTFAGFLPAIGDLILDPNLAPTSDRRDPEERVLLKVVGRVFNSRDDQASVTLIVDDGIRVAPIYAALLPQA